MKPITILNEKKWVRNNISYHEIKIEPPKEVEIQRFGFDPGTTHMGVSFLMPSYAYIYEIEMRRNPDPVQRVFLTHWILSSCLNTFQFRPTGVIEGAAYGKVYRQVELAEVRATMVLWCKEHNIDVKILPPKSIRKEVFGNGDTLAHDVWTNLPQNGAAALSCCLVDP